MIKHTPDFQCRQNDIDEAYVAVRPEERGATMEIIMGTGSCQSPGKSSQNQY